MRWNHFTVFNTIKILTVKETIYLFIYFFYKKGVVQLYEYIKFYDFFFFFETSSMFIKQMVQDKLTLP